MQVDPISKPHTPPAVTPTDHHKPLQGFEDSTVSSSRPVDPSFKPSKPVLDPPSNPILHSIEFLNQRTETVFDAWLKVRESHIENQFNAIEANTIEQSRQMDEALASSKTASFWGTLDDIASTLSSATGFFFGTSAALAGHPVIGGTLIASGVLSIGNLAFKHSHIWDFAADSLAGNNKELKEQVKTYLPSALGLASVALTFAGSYGAWRYAAQSGMQMASGLFEGAANIADGLIKYKSGMTNADHKWRLADLNALQSTTDISRMILENFIGDAQEFHERQTSMYETIGKTLEERDQTIQMVQQPV